MAPGDPAAISSWSKRCRRHIPLCLARRSHARRTLARAVATLFGGRNTPTTGTPSIAATKSHSTVPLDSSGHSVANEPASASSDRRPIACNHRTVLDSSRRMPSSPYAASASYPDTAPPRSIFVGVGPRPGAVVDGETPALFLTERAAGNGTNWYDSEHRSAPSSAARAGVPVTVAPATSNAETPLAAAATASDAVTSAGAPTSGDCGVPGRRMRGVEAYAKPPPRTCDPGLPTRATPGPAAGSSHGTAARA